MTPRKPEPDYWIVLAWSPDEDEASFRFGTTDREEAELSFYEAAEVSPLVRVLLLAGQVQGGVDAEGFEELLPGGSLAGDRTVLLSGGGWTDTGTAFEAEGGAFLAEFVPTLRSGPSEWDSDELWAVVAWEDRAVRYPTVLALPSNEALAEEVFAAAVAGGFPCVVRLLLSMPECYVGDRERLARALTDHVRFAPLAQTVALPGNEPLTTTRVDEHARTCWVLLQDEGVYGQGPRAHAITDPESAEQWFMADASQPHSRTLLFRLDAEAAWVGREEELLGYFSAPGRPGAFGCPKLRGWDAHTFEVPSPRGRSLSSVAGTATPVAWSPWGTSGPGPLYVAVVNRAEPGTPFVAKAYLQPSDMLAYYDRMAGKGYRVPMRLFEVLPHGCLTGSANAMLEAVRVLTGAGGPPTEPEGGPYEVRELDAEVLRQRAEAVRTACRKYTDRY